MIALITYDYSSLLTNKTQQSFVKTNLDSSLLNFCHTLKAILTLVPAGRIREGCKLKPERFRLGPKENTFTTRIAWRWNRLHWEVVQPPSSDVSRPDCVKPWVIWSDLRANPCFEEDVGPGTSCSPFQPELPWDARVLLIFGNKVAKFLKCRLPTEDAHRKKTD